jgi:hypothetical protein
MTTTLPCAINNSPIGRSHPIHTNTARFWLQRKPDRCRLCPVDPKDAAVRVKAKHAVRAKTKNATVRSKAKDTVHIPVNNGKAKRVSKLSRHPLSTAVAILSTVGVYATVNTAVHALQGPSPILEHYAARYTTPNTWLYANSPDQMFGLHEPLWPRCFQPTSITNSVFRRHAKYWSDDAFRKHKDKFGALPPTDEFYHIARRFQNAKEQFYRRPPWFKHAQPNMTLPLADNLPFLEPDCVCTITRVAASALEHAMTPFWKHASPPQTDDDLRTHCPCSLHKALARWRDGTWPNRLPPATLKYYDGAPHLTWWYKMGLKAFKGDELTPAELAEAQAQGWLKPKPPKQTVFNDWGRAILVDDDDYIL